MFPVNERKSENAIKSDERIALVCFVNKSSHRTSESDGIKFSVEPQEMMMRDLLLLLSTISSQR